jgi:hypothetical protein
MPIILSNMAQKKATDQVAFQMFAREIPYSSITLKVTLCDTSLCRLMVAV